MAHTPWTNWKLILVFISTASPSPIVAEWDEILARGLGSHFHAFAVSGISWLWWITYVESKGDSRWGISEKRLARHRERWTVFAKRSANQQDTENKKGHHWRQKDTYEWDDLWAWVMVWNWWKPLAVLTASGDVLITRVLERSLSAKQENKKGAYWRQKDIDE